MAVDRTALWILMGLCSIGGRRRDGPDGLRTVPPRRLRRVGTVLGVMPDGVGVGLTVALIMLLTAATVVRVEDLLR